MASSSSNNFEDLDERFDQIFDQQFENLLIRHGEHQGQKRNEPTLKDNEKKDTCSYGTIILVKMQHILLTCFDDIFE